MNLKSAPLKSEVEVSASHLEVNVSHLRARKFSYQVGDFIGLSCRSRDFTSIEPIKSYKLVRKFSSIEMIIFNMR